VIRMERLLTLREVADLLRISPWTLYHLVGRGQIPYQRVGRRGLRFRPSALDDWLKTHAPPTAAEAGASAEQAPPAKAKHPEQK
jgi:excisionase family DNA binding protein